MVAVVGDQASKFAISAADPYVALPHAEPVISATIIPGILYIDAGTNSGLALGQSQGFALAAALLTVFVLTVLIGKLALAGDVLPARVNIALGLVIGGAIGNVIDRVRLGYVIDFIFVDVPGLDAVIFNLADVALVVGLAMLVIAGPDPWRRYWYALRTSRRIVGRHGRRARPGDRFGID
jgi:signal peptidase II